MNPIAEQLNQTLSDTRIPDLLSDFGRRLYFPRGVVAQTAEAARAAHRFNATVGMATDGTEPLYLDSIRSLMPDLSPEEIFTYAPTGGLPELRRRWREEIAAKNPRLDGATSLPMVTSGLTHGITVTTDLFVDRGDLVLVPDLFWGNYRLIVEERRQARLATYPFYDADGGLGVAALADALNDISPGGKVVLVLNFPNNPTGYTPTTSEMTELAGVLRAAAARGVNLVVICDDAYFGLFFESDSCRQSLFAYLADADERLLAVKVDGATKENYVWGFRIGFLTFAARGLSEDHFATLEQKVMGAVRSSVSSSSMLAQSLLLRAMRSGAFQAEQDANLAVIAERYRLVRDILTARAGSGGPLQPLPFNSGYFLTLRVAGGKAEVLRQALLRRGVGTISVGDDYLRVAFSTVASSDLEALFEEIYSVAREVADSS
jgi:aspartate/methionine/tyrosine aminotransferase